MYKQFNLYFVFIDEEGRLNWKVCLVQRQQHTPETTYHTEGVAATTSQVINLWSTFVCSCPHYCKKLRKFCIIRLPSLRQTTTSH